MSSGIEARQRERVARGGAAARRARRRRSGSASTPPEHQRRAAVPTQARPAAPVRAQGARGPRGRPWIAARSWTAAATPTPPPSSAHSDGEGEPQLEAREARRGAGRPAPSRPRRAAARRQEHGGSAQQGEGAEAGLAAWHPLYCPRRMPEQKTDRAAQPHRAPDRAEGRLQEAQLASSPTTRRTSRKGGTFIKTKKPLPIGTRFLFKLTVPQREAPFELLGEVVWSKADGEEPGMGIRFIYSDDTQRADFEGVVEQLMADSLGRGAHREAPQQAAAARELRRSPARGAAGRGAAGAARPARRPRRGRRAPPTPAAATDMTAEDYVLRRCRGRSCVLHGRLRGRAPGGGGDRRHRPTRAPAG